jgi:hypothetical protein
MSEAGVFLLIAAVCAVLHFYCRKRFIESETERTDLLFATMGTGVFGFIALLGFFCSMFQSTL